MFFRQTASHSIAGYSLLELTVTMSLLGYLLGSLLNNFTSSHSMLQLRVETMRVASFLRKAIPIAQAQQTTQQITVEASSLTSSSNGQLLLKQPVKIMTPTKLFIYPTRVLSPFTLIITNLAGSCRITLSLRARIKTACLREG